MEFPLRGEHLRGLSGTTNTPEHLLRSHADICPQKNGRQGQQRHHAIGRSKRRPSRPAACCRSVLSSLDISVDFSEDVADGKVSSTHFNRTSDNLTHAVKIRICTLEVWESQEQRGRVHRGEAHCASGDPRGGRFRKNRTNGPPTSRETAVFSL